MASKVPTRCGSAPPCIEESVAFIQSSMLTKPQHQSSIKSSIPTTQVAYRESEEKVLSDPAYYAYYRAHVNLNPRLPPPVPSRDGQRIVHNTAGFKSLVIRQMLLSTHREEPKEDQPRRQAPSSLGRSRSFVDLKQADDPMISLVNPPPGFDLKRSNSLGTYKELQTSTSPSYAPPVTTTKDIGHFCNSVPHGSDTSGAESILRALNISVTTVSEQSERKHKETFLSDSRLHDSPHQQCTVQQVQRVQAQYTSQSSNSYHVGMTTLSGSYPNILGTKHLMLNPAGLTPALTEAYMTSGSYALYPNVPPPGIYNLQYNLDGYHTPPYAIGYVPQTAYPIPIDPYMARYAQYFSKVYGHHGLSPHPAFWVMLQGHCAQPPFKNDRIDPYNPLLPQTESNLAALMNDKYHTFVENMNMGSSVPKNGSENSGGGYYILSQGFSATDEDLSSVQHSRHRTGNFYGQLNSPSVSHNVDDPTRHSFLEAQRSYGDGNLELSFAKGKIIEFSADQHGSRFIQQKLESCCIKEIETVLSEVLSHTTKLMTDVFGNYVIQKLFEHGSEEQRRRLADQIVGKMLNLSLQMYGCRVIQKAVEVIQLDQKVKLVQELDGNVVKCVHDQNGNHVIQKCIECIPAKEIGFIISSFRNEVATLSKHPYGCRVIQRILENCSDDPVSRFIVDEILESASSLARDQYGNYVIQHVLEMGSPQVRSQIMSQLYGGFVEMSQHKYASNVVEKCLKHGEGSEQEAVIWEIIGKPEENANDLLALMKDQFANYVIQRILDQCTEEQREVVMNSIRDNLNALKKYTYGKHIVARYDKLSVG